MSKPNRNKVFIGFGAVAIVVIAAVAFWPPTFLSEEASGAIGVVQKHHAPQIAQKDVILGSEKLRAQQRVLYGDFFDAAKKLQGLSASLASGEKIGNVAGNVEALASELRSEYANEMLAALSQMELGAKQNNQIDLANQAAELASEVKQQNAETLSSAEMHEFSDKFANLAAMESKHHHNFEIANQELASALASKDETQAASHIENAEQQLANVDLASIELADQQEYFANIEAAANSLASLNLGSEALAVRIENAEALADRADSLAEAALANIQEQTANAVELASVLNELASKEAGSRENGSAERLGMKELGHAIELAEKAFGSQTGSSFQAELGAMNDFAASKTQYENMAGNVNLASMVGNQEIANKLYSQLGNTEALAHTAELMNQSLANQELANVLSNESQLANQAEQLASKTN